MNFYSLLQASNNHQTIIRHTNTNSPFKESFILQSVKMKSSVVFPVFFALRVLAASNTTSGTVSVTQLEDSGCDILSKSNTPGTQILMTNT